MCIVYTYILDMYLWGTSSPTDILTSKIAGFSGWLFVCRIPRDDRCLCNISNKKNNNKSFTTGAKGTLDVITSLD